MTSGTPPWALVAAAAFMVAIDVVNVLSALHDAPRFRLPGQAWRLFASEGSSAISTLALLPLVALAVRYGRAARSVGWGRFAMVHLSAAVVYSMLHVGGFVLIRRGVWALMGAAYWFGPLTEWVYEFRKDALSYVLIAALFALARSAATQVAPASTQTPVPPSPLFEIRDGPRVIRAPAAEILAAVSAGNYVEFKLADGRTPLMRTTLTAVEAALGPMGFVRTHRSWLVNAAGVRQIAPAGSGDRRLTLAGGVEAPLSRRYAQALQHLRAIT